MKECVQCVNIYINNGFCVYICHFRNEKVWKMVDM